MPYFAGSVNKESESKETNNHEANSNSVIPEAGQPACGPSDPDANGYREIGDKVMPFRPPRAMSEYDFHREMISCCELFAKRSLHPKNTIYLHILWFLRLVLPPRFELGRPKAEGLSLLRMPFRQGSII